VPSIFQTQCGQCGYAGDSFSDFYGAVLLDEPLPGKPQAVVAGAAIFGASADAPLATADDSRLLVLAHPGERDDLASAGYTWRSVLKAGRYVAVHTLFCKSCGQQFERQQLAVPGAYGCGVSLALAVAAGIAIGVWRRSFLIGWLGGMAALVALPWLLNRAAHWRLLRKFADRAKAIDHGPACLHCGSLDTVAAHRAANLPCPACKTRSLQVNIIGMS
jgi:predicted Zn-ribbon and HTH transcriptional regulator